MMTKTDAPTWKVKRSVYHDLREDGMPRIRSFLVAHGYWIFFPWIFKWTDEEDPGFYVTKTGRILTERDMERLADEAERGYDISKIEEKQ